MSEGSDDRRGSCDRHLGSHRLSEDCEGWTTWDYQFLAEMMTRAAYVEFRSKDEASRR